MTHWGNAQCQIHEKTSRDPHGTASYPIAIYLALMADQTESPIIIRKQMPIKTN